MIIFVLNQFLRCTWIRQYISRYEDQNEKDDYNHDDQNRKNMIIIIMIKIPPLHLYLSVHFWRPVRHDRPHTGFDLLLYLSALLLDCTANEHFVKWCEIKYSVSVVWNCIIHISLFIAYYCAPCIVFWFEHCSALDKLFIAYCIDNCMVHNTVLCTMHCILVWALQCFGHDLRDKLPPSCCPFASPIIFWKSDHHDNNEDGENGDDGEEEEDDDDENGDDGKYWNDDDNEYDDHHKNIIIWWQRFLR